MVENKETSCTWLIFETIEIAKPVKIPDVCRDMRLLKNVKLDNHYFNYSGDTRKIFSIGYEDLTTLIYYQDANNNYTLVISKENDPPLILEKRISRAEAFRIMNTRP
jgi:hypothetical protein